MFGSEWFLVENKGLTVLVRSSSQCAGRRPFCLQTVAQPWPSNTVSLLWPSGFSFAKSKDALIA